MRISYIKRSMLYIALLGMALLWLYSNLFNKPRVLAVSEVPVAFWAWRANVPTAAELQAAIRQTEAKVLFLRAGQLDLVDGSVKRIKPVAGSLSSPIEIHVVYNSTPGFLSDWENLATDRIAQQVYETYKTDLARAQRDQTEIAGLQLDFDIPTRLLSRYAELLHSLRKLLPAKTKLSITGLQTWVTAKEIEVVLAEVDFWIPQCYGASIPMRLDQRIPISSASDVERTMKKVRRLNKPFYAGLSAYGQAILYGNDGKLLELRGNIDPLEVEEKGGFELVEKENFSDKTASEIRYVYRAKGDVVLDGLVARAGESLVLIVPSTASLRAGARAVRENAGHLLLGICVFRLPTAGDNTTLSLDEIASALSETEQAVSTILRVEIENDGRLILNAENSGTASAISCKDALTIDIAISPGKVGRSIALDGFTKADPLCGPIESHDLQSCSPVRANVMRLTASSWKPGSKATAAFYLETGTVSNFPAFVTTHLSDGRVVTETFDLDFPTKRETK